MKYSFVHFFYACWGSCFTADETTSWACQTILQGYLSQAWLQTLAYFTWTVKLYKDGQAYFLKLWDLQLFVPYRQFPALRAFLSYQLSETWKLFLDTFRESTNRQAVWSQFYNLVYKINANLKVFFQIWAYTWYNIFHEMYIRQCTK